MVEIASKSGYFILPQLWSLEKCLHVLGGKNDENALCPNCNQPLLRFLLFSAKDEKFATLNLELDWLPLYFCWRCQLSQGLFVYRLNGRGDSIEIMQYQRGPTIPNFPYENYPINFPAIPCRLYPLMPETQEIIYRLNTRNITQAQDCFGYLDVPRHQIGGMPFLLQGVDDHNLHQKCIECGKSSLLISSIGDSAFGEISFTGNPFVQVLYFFCSQCKIVSCYQQCD